MPDLTRRRHPRAAALALLALTTALTATLTACGGGGDGSTDAAPTPPPPPPPPVSNQAPVPRFDAPTNVVAGQPAVLDGRASSDPEGSALRFTWDFGDGSAGGTAQVAHVYPAAGSYTARLLVSDAQGATAELTRSISVSAAPVAARSVAVTALVTGIDGQPLAGVSITVQGSSASPLATGADGRATLPGLGVGVDVVLRLSKAGYTDQVKRLSLPASTGSDARVEASLMPRASATTLADAAAGGTANGSDGASLVLPAGTLVDAATGAAVTGAVQVTLTPVDINASALAAFPGRFEGLNADGSRTPIVSFGTTEFTLTQGGRPLQLKPGARATIDLPVYASQDLGGAALAAGGSLPLWSLDERSGQWVNEGSGTLVVSSASPTGLAMRAEVGHFSWWNADKGYTPYRPKPKCINDVPGQYDSIFEQATICKMLAEMDKPIPAQGAGQRIGLAQALAARPVAAAAERPGAQAAATAPRFPFPAVRIDGDVPMAGGVALDVPPDSNVVLTGTALNGTWRGQVTVTGGQGITADVNVPLRPVAVGGSSEAITLPFDAVRSAVAFRLDSYRFSATAGQGVVVTLAPEGSTLTGTLRLRHANGTVLHAGAFGPDAVMLSLQLPDAGDYTIEMQPATGAPGGYRLQASAASVPAAVPGQWLGSANPLSSPAVVSQGSSALALWVQLVNGTPQLMGSRYGGASDGWSNATALAAAPGYDDRNGLQAQVDDAGQVWVAWTTASGPRVARGPLNAGTAWAAAQALASSNCPGGLAQRLAVNAAGQAVLVWQRSGATTGWCARRYEAGTWAAEAVIASTPPASNAGLAVAMTPAGQAVAAWPLASSGGLAVAQQDGAAANWSSPTLLVTAGNAAANPAIAGTSDGSLVLAWQAPGAVQAAYRATGAAWGAVQSLGSASSSAANPQVVWLGSDRLAVGFNGFSGGPRVVEHRAATGWGTAQLVGTTLSLPLMTSMAGGSDGSAVLVSAANSRSGIGLELGFSRRDPATGGWTDASIPLASRQASNSPDLWRYSAAAVNAGQAAVLWLDFIDTSGLNLRFKAARLAATP